MYKRIQRVNDLDFGQLADVYEESLNTGSSNDFLLPEQVLYADAACFLNDKNAFYALWEAEGKYVSSLRMESYLDGLLLEGLETAPAQRGKGYATRLVGAVLQDLSQRGNCVVYSHIHKKNAPSLAVHQACGFTKTRDCAVFIDGSVSHDAYTMKIYL